MTTAPPSQGIHMASCESGPRLSPPALGSDGWTCLSTTYFCTLPETPLCRGVCSCQDPLCHPTHDRTDRVPCVCQHVQNEKEPATCQRPTMPPGGYRCILFFVTSPSGTPVPTRQGVTKAPTSAAPQSIPQSQRWGRHLGA